MVEPYLVLADFIVAMKSSLFFGHPMVAMGCNRCSRQHLNLGDYANWRHTTHLFAGCSHK